MRTHPVDKLLEQHCYTSLLHAGLLQLVRLYVCSCIPINPVVLRVEEGFYILFYIGFYNSWKTYFLHLFLTFPESSARLFFPPLVQLWLARLWFRQITVQLHAVVYCLVVTAFSSVNIPKV